MAAPDFSAYQYLAMSTGTGAQRADISGPWPPWPAVPPTQHRQQWDSNFQADNSSLPPPMQWNHRMTNQYQPPNLPPTSYYPYAVHGGHAVQMYPHSMYSFSSHQPRPPPAIRSGHADSPINLGRSVPDVYHMPPSHTAYHSNSQGPLAYSMPPQPAEVASDTASVAFDGNLSPESTSGGGGDSSNHGYSLHSRPSESNQIREVEQSQQRQAVRNSILRRIEDAEQRVPRNLNAQTRRSDRSSSPRSSARRSFNRYSADLSQSGTSSDAEEAAARSPPSNRTRHQRPDSRSRFFRQAYDPRIITDGQLQQLKASLPKLVLGDLPTDALPTCDICAKDYSAIPVEPSEEEEIAVKLPCGHYFGESCLAQWVRSAQSLLNRSLTSIQFDTCKTHKNKVTCPMCRKQLIEPPQSPYTANPFSPGGLHPSAYMLARNSQSFRELLISELQVQHARA